MTSSDKLYIDIPLEVSVRTYEVDKERLKELLRTSRTLSIAEIAKKLNKPQTLVEHWFRRDDDFAIPDADIWYSLKELLNIQTDEFDTPITSYTITDSNFDSRNRLYAGDVAPTLTVTCGQLLFLV